MKLARLFPLGLAALAAVAQAAPPEAALAGRYYLQGVREVGSELRLHEDGRFEWMLAYGAVDQYAEGRWTRAGDEVVLVPARAPAGRPLFELGETVPWEEDDEERLREKEQLAAEGQAAARCPFLQDEADEAAPAAAVPADAASASAAADPTPTAEQLQAHAAHAAARFQAARIGAAVAMLEAAARIEREGTAAAEAAIVRARAARTALRAAYREAQNAAWEAGLDGPEWQDPELPAFCRIAVEPGSGGYAVRVHDEYYGLNWRGIEVEFGFSDGHRETRTTDRGGWAGVRPRAQATLEQVRLRLRGQEGTVGENTLAVAPPGPAVLQVRFDARQTVPLPFDELRLRVEDGALLPEHWDEGRYVRE
ncbi:MAG: hypothetical protein ACOY9B_10600 [Pseudomonadota bacterium]